MPQTISRAIEGKMRESWKEQWGSRAPVTVVGMETRGGGAADCRLAEDMVRAGGPGGGAWLTEGGERALLGETSA